MSPRAGTIEVYHCWRCREAVVPLFGQPCPPCLAALLAEHDEWSAQHPGQLRNLPLSGRIEPWSRSSPPFLPLDG